MASEIIAAADGSALGNPGPAGWAWYVNDECWGAGGWKHGTNNMGELKAVLELLKSTDHVADRPLKILCDSKYTIDSLTKWMHGWKKKGWKKADGKPVLNLDLFKELDAALVGRKCTFEWVKGHAGHPMNEAADKRARAAATAYRDGKTPAQGPGFTLGEPVEKKTSEAVSPSLSHSVENAPSTTADSSCAAAVDSEKNLWEESIFSDESTVRRILSEDFTWVTPTGKIINRDTVIQFRLNAFQSVEEPEIIATQSLGADAAHILSTVQTPRANVMRTSLWKRTGGEWRLEFRQETAIPPAR